MCGVVGGIFRRPVTDRDVQAVRTAVRTLAHRGPDAEAVAVVSDANAILGFRRLAIIDLATGDQPMATGTGQHLVFNGEIYNYRELRVGLTAAGVQFRTSSDTEVLLHTLARREGGASALAQLRGMFTFGFLDVPAGVLPAYGLASGTSRSEERRRGSTRHAVPEHLEVACRLLPRLRPCERDESCRALLEPWRGRQTGRAAGRGRRSIRDRSPRCRAFPPRRGCSPRRVPERRPRFESPRGRHAAAGPPGGSHLHRDVPGF